MQNSNTTTTTDKRITIALSNEPPVRIDPRLWPIIARAEWHDGKVECQANHVRFIRVRRHADGRSIVYGKLDSGPGGVPIGWRGAHAGYRVQCAADQHDAEVIRAIRRVAGVICDDAMADECIADLPARELV